MIVINIMEVKLYQNMIKKLAKNSIKVQNKILTILVWGIPEGLKRYKP